MTTTTTTTNEACSMNATTTLRAQIIKLFHVSMSGERRVLQTIGSSNFPEVRHSCSHVLIRPSRWNKNNTTRDYLVLYPQNSTSTNNNNDDDKEEDEDKDDDKNKEDADEGVCQNTASGSELRTSAAVQKIGEKT
jgi:hypothetical protein